MAKNTFLFYRGAGGGSANRVVPGKIRGLVVPAGSIRDLFATDISAGLSPTHLDLRVIELTFGCMLKFNITSLLGIIGAAIIFRKITA